MIQTADVFCRVVDNLGDAGVCWRFTRQLASEHQLTVRLWIDQPATLDAFVLGEGAEAALLTSGHIQVCDLVLASTTPQPADLVIETFGCDVPEPYAQRMTQRSPPSLWYNLEYLSAEDWVEGCHALPSPHPTLPITRCFFFPGFTHKTGGLLREHGLLERRKAFQQAHPAIHHTNHLAYSGKTQGTPDSVHRIKVSIFCYDHPLLDALLDAFEYGHQHQGRGVECSVFQGPAQLRIQNWIALHPNHTTHFTFLPWLSQDQFDAVLWNSDFNVVRGEDSFVRAQWAGRPFLWDIYPTDDAAHLVKMAAFLRRYRAGWNETKTALELGMLWQAWVRREPDPIEQAWLAVSAALPHLTEYANAWSDQLSQHADLTSALLDHATTRSPNHFSSPLKSVRG